MKKKKKTPRKPRFQQIYDGLNMSWIPVWTLGQEVPTPGDMPTSVTVLGQKYRVRYRTEIYNTPRKSTPLWGVVVFENRIILIDPRQPMHKLKQTLLHEMCHVYMREIRMKDNRLDKTTNAEEEGFCDLFGEAVSDLVANNPPLK